MYFSLGIDVGSTTAKLLVLDEKNEPIYSEYIRHKALIKPTVLELLQKVKAKFPDTVFKVSFTGSAGMGIAERASVDFVQEVVASSLVIKSVYPEVKTLIDIGGEDGKIIYFEKEKLPDMRMNGSCAGGTGAFIDQMAGLLNVDVAELDALARASGTIYPIASRCGVFAKTDIQNLLSRKISKEDIAASVFHAVALQTINSLARGVDPKVKVLFSGGPLTFIPSLRKAFMSLLQFDEEDCILSEQSALLPAWGAALSESETIYSIDDLIEKIGNITADETKKDRQQALFTSVEEFEQWKNERGIVKVERHEITGENEQYYLGIDSGSTTSKLVLIDSRNRVVYSKYSHNKGATADVIKEALVEISEQYGEDLQIAGSAVTGYGEDLVKAALGIDHGIVETIAHYTGASYVDPDVSFILDIGGQDMKAIFIKDGHIHNLEINEACSSGCGSFVENFAQNLSYTAAEFADIACSATAPCDLGTRCTVFMNSKVKQYLREGAEVKDISAGLAYSVIKNCLYKVLKLSNMEVLGNNIVVQGGSFRSMALVRALEIESGKSVKSSDIPELMGAFGAALYAAKQTAKPRALKEFTGDTEVESKQIVCKACSNHCTVTRFKFHNGGVHYSGNKCEKVFSNKGEQQRRGQNIYEFKYDLLFNRETKAVNPLGVSIGIPRILGMYESFPFWNTLLTNSGIDVVLSDDSTLQLTSWEKEL